MSWIQTFSGRRFNLVDTKPEDFIIEDIAHALAYQSRYAGHCLRYYSVAEHCWHLWSRAKKHRREALMHDSTEAYLSDVPGPVKNLLPGYKEMEHKLAELIAERFNLKYPWPEEVHDLDMRILLDERAQNMPVYVEDTVFELHAFDLPPEPAGYTFCIAERDGWPFHLKPLEVQLKFWTPPEAEQHFLKAFYESPSSRY